MSPGNGSPDRRTKVDKLLQTLSNPVRREIIRYFETRSAGTTASLEELVAHVGGRLASTTSDELWTTLYQDHLPTLQSRGWLEFDTECNVVSYHGHQEAEQLLREVHDIFEK